jgi:predicted esterase
MKHAPTPAGIHHRRVSIPPGSPIILLASLAFLSGCPSLESLPTQSPVQELMVEQTQKPFLLYAPSHYAAGRTWPLLIVCHGTWPYDTPKLQMQEWAMFAENNGLFVAAPRLDGVKGDFPPPPDKQIELQRSDERTILAVVATVKQRYNIAEDRVFMTGWSAGAYAILYAGLNHPEIFRALAIRQGSFDPRYMDISPDRVDSWQPIKVIYGSTDVIRDQTKECIKWLRDNGAYVEEEEIPGTHRRISPNPVWKFFKEVSKERLWIRMDLKQADPANPLSIRFALNAIPPVVRQRWFFDNGDESTEPSPVHVYPRPGYYEVSVNVSLKNGKKYTRKRVVEVGNARPE